MSGKYMVSFELPECELEVAYGVAQQIVASGLAAWGYRIDIPITVSCPITPAPRADRQWSVHASGHPVLHPRRSFVLAFDANERRGAAVIMDDEPADTTQHTIYMRPRAMARVVRAVMQWPLDLLETMASEDEAKRRGGG